ncbi:MAG: FixH family protein [Elusimicrobiaceae bacterium]|nr:FixH family protein [Elusimicrobiaceae bacterium]
MMKKTLLIIAVIFLLALGSTGCSKQANSSTITLSNGQAFTYQFVEKPKVGEVILKVTASQPANNVHVFAQYDMPSMRGHHASGKQAFLHNKSGDFVLPVHFAMPGDWEIVLSFEQDSNILGNHIITLNI